MTQLINLSLQPGNQSDLVEALKTQLEGKGRQITFLQTLVRQQPEHEHNLQAV